MIKKSVIENIIEMANKGESISKIYEATNSFVLKDEYQDIGKMKCGWRRVCNKKKLYNFINVKGDLISTEWFDEATDFTDGYAFIDVIDRGNRYHNILKADGTFVFQHKLIHRLRPITVNKVPYFIITEKRGWSFIIDKDMQIVGGKKYKYVCDPVEGISIVANDGMWGYLRLSDGKLINDGLLYAHVNNFANGIANVNKNDKWFFINTEGENVFDATFDNASSFTKGFSVVSSNGKYNIIKDDGTFVFKEWAEDIKSNNYSKKLNYLVKWKDGVILYSRKDGELFGGKIDNVYYKYSFDCAKFLFVRRDGKMNVVVASTASLAHEEWLTDAQVFSAFNGTLIIKKDNGKYNIIDHKGKMLSPIDFDAIMYSIDGDTVYVDIPGMKNVQFSYNSQLTDEWKKLMKEMK